MGVSLEMGLWFPGYGLGGEEAYWLMPGRTL
jgi:hypothetical protein